MDITLSRHHSTPPWRLTQVSLPKVHWGNMRILTTGDLREDESRADSNQHSDLDGPHACLQWCLSRSLSQQPCPPAEPSWGPCWAKEIGSQFCLIWIPNQWDILAMAPILCPRPVQRADFQSFPTLQHSLPSYLPPGNKAREVWQAWSTSIACLGRKPSQKPGPAMEQSLWPQLSRKPEW